MNENPFAQAEQTTLGLSFIGCMNPGVHSLQADKVSTNSNPFKQLRHLTLAIPF